MLRKNSRFGDQQSQDINPVIVGRKLPNKVCIQKQPEASQNHGKMNRKIPFVHRYDYNQEEFQKTAL